MANSDSNSINFGQIAKAITNSLASLPADTPQEVENDLSQLQNLTTYIAKELAVETVGEALADLKKSAEKIKEVTKKLEKAIEDIKDRDIALGQIAGLVNQANILANDLLSNGIA